MLTHLVPIQDALCKFQLLHGVVIFMIPGWIRKLGCNCLADTPLFPSVESGATSQDLWNNGISTEGSDILRDVLRGLFVTQAYVYVWPGKITPGRCKTEWEGNLREHISLGCLLVLMGLCTLKSCVRNSTAQCVEWNCTEENISLCNKTSTEMLYALNGEVAFETLSWKLSTFLQFGLKM